VFNQFYGDRKLWCLCVFVRPLRGDATSSEPTRMSKFTPTISINAALRGRQQDDCRTCLITASLTANISAPPAPTRPPGRISNSARIRTERNDQHKTAERPRATDRFVKRARLGRTGPHHQQQRQCDDPSSAPTL
jgi:hypothetical protein